MLASAFGRPNAGWSCCVLPVPPADGSLQPGGYVVPDPMLTPCCLQPLQSLQLSFVLGLISAEDWTKSLLQLSRFAFAPVLFFENIRKPAEEILVQLLLQSRAQPSLEVDEVAVSWKRIRSISMQKEQNASNSHCCRGFCIPGQAGCYSSVRSRKSEIKQDAWCACLHINTRSVFSLACTAQCNWCWRAGAIPEFPTLVHAASP